MTLVALSADGIRTDTSLGPVRIIRVPVSFDLRDAARERAASRRARGLPLLRPVDDERDRLFRRVQAARQRDGQEGRAAAWSAATREQTLRGRRYLGRVGARVSRLGWGAADRVRSRVTVAAAWRRVHPDIDDIELAYGPVIDALQPDLIHAHDVEMMPVAARAVARARAQGRVVPWIYDAHEWVVGLSRYAGRTPRRIAAWAYLAAGSSLTADISPDGTSVAVSFETGANDPGFTVLYDLATSTASKVAFGLSAVKFSPAGGLIAGVFHEAAYEPLSGEVRLYDIATLPALT